jgi:hypothetical protein
MKVMIGLLVFLAEYYLADLKMNANDNKSEIFFWMNEAVTELEEK